MRRPRWTLKIIVKEQSMTKAKILAFLAVMAMVLIVPAVAFAQAVPPHIFIGSVTVNGLSAPTGTVVSAVVGGVEQGNTTVSSTGSYTLQVSQGSGTDIVFMVDTLTASETATWQQGGADVLNLTAGSGAVAGAGTDGARGASGAKGSKGDKGDAGERGPAGPAGPAGSAGSAGSDGKAGAAGSDGAAGAAGSDGAAGKAGAAGSSGGGGPVGLIALILSIVAILGVIGVYFASKQPAA